MSLKRLFRPSSAIASRPLSSFSCWNFCSCVSFGFAATSGVAARAMDSIEADSPRSGAADCGLVLAASAMALSFLSYHSASPWTLAAFASACEEAEVMLASETMRLIREAAFEGAFKWPDMLASDCSPRLAMLALPPRLRREAFDAMNCADTVVFRGSRLAAVEGRIRVPLLRRGWKAGASFPFSRLSQKRSHAKWPSFVLNRAAMLRISASGSNAWPALRHARNM